MKRLLNFAKKRIRSILQYISPNSYEAIHQMRALRSQKRADMDYWKPRIQEVMDCPDNVKIPRIPNAGKILNGFQLMHNGLLVKVDGYYGFGMTELLKANKGCHEPQEELIFSEVIRRLPTNARMVECGSYWGFYSMWFARDVPGAMAWLIEPESENIAVGQANFAANDLQGHFTQAYVGDTSRQSNDPQTGDAPQICIDDFLALHGIESLNILHADIQGAEVDMLNGARDTLTNQKVDYIFISTHGGDLHEDCVQLLKSYRYRVEVSVGMNDTCSIDGLIVAVRDTLVSDSLPMPSLKSTYLSVR